MHDRAVRRRRAVLVALIAASLDPPHRLLRRILGRPPALRCSAGVFGALSPIQEGASRVLKPFRDLFGWFGDTIDAKDQRDKAIAERDALPHASSPRSRTGCARPSSRRASTTIDTTGGMGQYGPVDARVIHALAATAGTSALTINKGSDDGVHRGDPVINGAGLVGKVAETHGRRRGGRR